MSFDDRDGLNSLNTDGLHLHTVYLNSEHPNRSHSPKRLAPCFTTMRSPNERGKLLALPQCLD